MGFNCPRSPPIRDHRLQSDTPSYGDIGLFPDAKKLGEFEATGWK